MFPTMEKIVFAWAPPWGAVCLWYAFLVQCFWPTKWVGTHGEQDTSKTSWAKLILPLTFLLEGVSHKSFLLGLTGGERLVIAYVLSSLMYEMKVMLFFMVFATQVLMSAFLGTSIIAQWCQFIVAIFSLQVAVGNRVPSNE